MSGQTWGDIISRNYSAGRAIADDFVSSRFAKKADELRTQYEDRANAEGKSLQDYLPDLEAELRELAAGVGATRRGVTGANGEALDMGAMGRIRGDVARQGEQRAGVLALAGDQAGARQTRAGAQYAIGEFDAGQGQQIAGDTIAATTAAINPDGTYDQQKGALGVAKVGAQYGNADAAAQQTEQADTFRMKSGAAKATQLYNLIANGGEIDNDQFVGLWEGIKQDLPEYKNVDLRLNEGKVYIYEGGVATGDLDPQEAAQMLQAAIQSPGQAIQNSMSAQLKAIEDQKTQRAGVDNKILDASLKVVENLKAAGIPDTVATAVLAAQKATASTSGGWQLQDIGEEPGTFMMQKGGDVFVIKTNVAPDLAAGEVGGPLQVFLSDGKTPAPPGVLDKADAQNMQQSLMDLSVAKAQAGTRMNLEVMGQQLRVLNELGAAYGGSQRSMQGATSGGGSSGGNSRAERNNNPGNIEDRGQFKGMPGYKGSDGRFAIFDSPEAGQKAMQNQLLRYMDGKTTGEPLTTVNDIIGTWSPQNDPTNQAGSTSNYANYVAKKLGIAPDAQISREQLPQLAAAMAEFESGNTGGGAPTSGGKNGAMTMAGISAEQRAKYGAAPSAVAAGATAATAQSAPAQQTQVPGKKQAISPEFVKKQAGDLLRLRDEYYDAEEQLAKFDEYYQPEVERSTNDRGAGAGAIQTRGLSPAQAKTRKELVARLEQAGRGLIDTRRETKLNAGALRRETAGRATDKEAEALAVKYGGSADFFNRAGSAGSR